MDEKTNDIKETAGGELTQGEFKVKKKPKKFSNKKTENAKIDLSKKEKDADTEPSTVGISNEEPTESVQEIEVSKPEVQQIEEKITEEVVNTIEEIEKPTEAVVETPVVESKKLPEGIEKLVSFMEQTGGDMQDYIRLNADYTNVDEDTLLKEYYKNTKPHLDLEEITFLMDEQFKVDEDYDEERAVRKKNLAKKEEVAKAKNHLEKVKKDYYEEIKLRPTVNNEITKANDFFNKFQQDKKIAEQKHEKFKTDTQSYFGPEFKGFEFDLGEKNFRYSVSNSNDIANAQSNISNVVKKFLNDKGEVVDIKGYHKAMYAARNADTIAQHFYEQGKADAVKDVIAKSKNISSEARQSKAPDDIFLNGLKVKAVSGINSSKLKIKRK